jgi:hypothetical protein
LLHVCIHLHRAGRSDSGQARWGRRREARRSRALLCSEAPGISAQPCCVGIPAGRHAESAVQHITRRQGAAPQHRAQAAQEGLPPQPQGSSFKQPGGPPLGRHAQVQDVTLLRYLELQARTQPIP